MNMELNITKFFNEAAPMDYSASQAELGPSAGADTWRAACDDSEEYPLLDTEEKREAYRADLKGYGAWSEEEIAAMSDRDLNALCIQFIASAMREADIDHTSEDFDWAAYEASENAGRFYRCDDGDVYYYVGD